MDRTTPPFQVTFRLERGDFVAMTHALTRPTRRWQWLLTAALIALLVVMLYATVGSLERVWLVMQGAVQGRLPWNLYVIFAFVLLIPWVSHYLAPLLAAMIFKRNAMANQDVTLTLDQAGIEGGSAGLQSRIAWSSVKRIIETPRHLFFTISKREAVTLPRRAFGSDQAYQAARAFALQQCGTMLENR